MKDDRLNSPKSASTLMLIAAALCGLVLLFALWIVSHG